MGLRLIILSWWTPSFIIRRELKNISDQTIAALTRLMPKNAAKTVDANPKQDYHRSIEERRAAMAQTQANIVEKLESALGRDEALRLGREALFAVGREIGKQTRSKLGVSENPADLAKAAKILYRVLGIEFDLKWFDSANAKVTIKRCALAEKYSKLACEVLSATDEGVINGLQSNVSMNFREYMTSGCKTCSAYIHFEQKERLP
jgi:hypothetical protein